MDSMEPDHAREMKVTRPDVGNQRCELNGDVDSDFPEPLMEEIRMTLFVDSDHGHDKVNGNSP